MKYTFKYSIKPIDFWQLSMYYTYSSIVGVCNIVFTAAMILMTTKFWTSAQLIVKLAMLIASSLFLIIQPLAVYIKAAKRAKAVPDNTIINLNEKGIYVYIKDKCLEIKWKTVKRIIKKPTMLVVFLTYQDVFILTNRLLGKQREEVYSYIMSKTQK